MSVSRALMCIIFPPLAVLDKGCGMAIIVGVLWLSGWLPGVLAAFAINMMDKRQNETDPRFVQIPLPDNTQDSPIEKPKRKGAYVRLSDGEIAEVIDDDGKMPDMSKRKRGSFSE